MTNGRALDLVGITDSMQDAALATEQLAKAHVADDQALIKHWSELAYKHLNRAAVLSEIVAREASKHLNRRSRLSEAA